MEGDIRASQNVVAVGDFVQHGQTQKLAICLFAGLDILVEFTRYGAAS